MMFDMLPMLWVAQGTWNGVDVRLCGRAFRGVQEGGRGEMITVGKCLRLSPLGFGTIGGRKVLFTADDFSLRAGRK